MDVSRAGRPGAAVLLAPVIVGQLMSAADVEQHCRKLEKNRKAWQGVDKEVQEAQEAAIEDCWRKARARAREPVSGGSHCYAGDDRACSQTPSSGGGTGSLEAAAQQFQQSMMDLMKRQRAAEARKLEEAENERRREAEREERRERVRAAKRASFIAELGAVFGRLASARERPGGAAPLEKTCLDPEDSALFQLVSPLSFNDQCGPVLADQARSKRCLVRLAKNMPVDKECEKECRDLTIRSRHFAKTCLNAGSFGLAWQGHEKQLGWSEWSWTTTSPAFETRSRVFWESAVLTDGSPGFRPTRGEMVFCPTRQPSLGFPGFLGATKIRFHWTTSGCSSLGAFDDDKAACKEHQAPADKLVASAVAGSCSRPFPVVINGPPLTGTTHFTLTPLNITVEDGSRTDTF